MKRIVLTDMQLAAYNYVKERITPMVIFTILVKGIMVEHGLIATDNFMFELKDNVLILDGVVTMGEYVSTY